MQKIEGIIPAIVQDFYTGKVLMLAYVNEESYNYMQKHGQTCFWSRSRGELWHKGETSGNTQDIKNMVFDCDNDTLLIQVEQNGSGACHTGSYSCFGEQIGMFETLNSVFSQIADRRINPKENSYTNYLLDKGVEKICKKIGEESAEAIIAAIKKDASQLADEICDLTYHILVLMLTQSITPRDIIEKMAKRHTIPGNLKAQNERGDL